MSSEYKITRNIEVTSSTKLNASIWVALARGAKVKYSLEPNFVSDTQRANIANWEIKEGTKWAVEIQEQVDSFPQPPKLEPGEYLALDKDLIAPSKAIQEKAKSLMGSNITDTINNIANYLVKELKYQHPPEFRDATTVFNTKQSDCGGYHTLLVSMLRSLNIPSVVDFGMRLPKYTPHVWAWYYNKDSKKWEFIDINDIQDNKTALNRVSYSLGVNPVVKEFPAKVQFIQNILIWDFNFEKNKVNKTPVLHKNNTIVKKLKT